MRSPKTILDGVVILNFILFIPGILIEGLNIILYSSISIFITYLLYKQILLISYSDRELKDKRARWIAYLLKEQIKEYNTDQKNLLLHKALPLHLDLASTELGLTRDKIDPVILPPDLEKAEEESVKLEERASFLLGGTVFVPVLFGLFHLFRSVTLIQFLFELLSAFVLSYMIILSQIPRYRVEYWREIYLKFNELSPEIVRGGAQSLLQFPELFEDPVVRELAYIPKIVDMPIAYHVFGHILLHLTQIPMDRRELILSQFLSDLRPLPQYEISVQNKWKAYENRVIMIGLAATSVSAMLAGMATYTLPTISTSILAIASTPYLSWGMYVLVLLINWGVLAQWKDSIGQIRWLLIYSLVYFMFFGLNFVLFS